VSQVFESGATVEDGDAVTEGAVVAPTEPGGAVAEGAVVVPAERGGADVGEPLLHPARASPIAVARGRSRTGRIRLS
jgi:hypothetical protein